MSWIWLPKERYPEYQNCDYCGHIVPAYHNYTVAEFARSYRYDKQVSRVHLCVSGDTHYRLQLNGRQVHAGPVCAGGDFLCVEAPPAFYRQSLTIETQGQELCFFAEVELGPSVMSDYSYGHGGFYLEAEVEFADGECVQIVTDTSWMCRRNARYLARGRYDGSAPQEEYVAAMETAPIWNLKDSLIPPMCEYRVEPKESGAIVVKPGETVTKLVPFDKIYAAYIGMHVSGAARIQAYFYEVEKLDSGRDYEELQTTEELDYKGMRFHSIGELRLVIQNQDHQAVTVQPCLYATHYPIEQEGSFVTSDTDLNRVYEVCKWALRICRQTIHLDSPRHQEPLSCTGDYYIESLMTAFTYGDMRLATFDLMRTADWMVQNDGVIFHVSYSLLWIQMLWDTYQFVGDRQLLLYCRPALDALLRRFETYTGENGLLERCPDYMFWDWNTVLGYNMHHPPKFLGQSALCMYYHGGLLTAERIYMEIDEKGKANACMSKAVCLREAIDMHLYERERGLYMDGLPTPDEVPTGQWLPENPPLRHFSKHANLLAVCYGVCEGEKAKQIAEAVMEDDSLPDMQPFFMHFALEALAKAGLLEKYFMPLMERWKEITAQCSKGLQEGWFAPDENGDYPFDYSHAWGGTPAYQLPSKMLGFEMIEPGFQKIQLKPDAYGLDYVRITMPTPYGEIGCEMLSGVVTDLTIPSGLRCHMVIQEMSPATITIATRKM